jgi:hypothetical protein
MADLISRAYVLAEYDRQHKGSPGGARKIIEDAPAVDAVTVEYLMKYAQLPTEFAIAAWRKQDKDAQEKQIKRLDKPMLLDDALNLVNEVFPLGQKEQEAQDG